LAKQIDMEETNPTTLETPLLRPEDIEDNPIPKCSPNCLFCKVNPKRSETSDYCKECWEKKQESKKAARLASKNGYKKLTPEAKIRIAREKLFTNGELCEQCTHRTPLPGKTLCVWCEEHGKPVEQIFDLSDLGNASRFEWRYGAEFLWTKATGWLRYKDGLWLEDKTHTTDQAMVHAITLIREEAALVRGDNAKAVAKEQEKILKFAQAQKSNAKINAALERASKLKSIAKDYAEFDTHDNLFHCSNGELDLETMVLLPHNPAYLATKGSSIKYDPTAECPGFEKYIHEVMGNNDNLIRYIQRCAGYTLTTATGEAAMFILTGTSGTGKTTFLNIIQRVMGLYAMRAQRGTLMAKRGDEGQPFDYAGLEGCRALVASETEEGKQIAVAKVKELSGNEKSLRACRKFRDSYEFEPKCKVWLACNDFPKAPAGDEALWDRLKPIPFDVKFRGPEGEVKDLAEKLVEEEGSGILNWMIRGLEQYTEIGLAVPEEARQKTQELRDEQDFLGRFLEERTAKTDAYGEMVLVSKLYDTFKMHADTTGEGRGWTRQKFNAEMRAKDYEDKKVRVGDKTPHVWLGVKLVSTFSADTFMSNMEQL
jgi:putative DNA primase/helicase